MKKLHILSLLAGSALLWSAGASALLIDDFATDQALSVQNGSTNGPAGGSVAGPGILGGTRNVVADATATGPSSAFLDVVAGSGATPPGSLNISNATGVNGVVILTYDAAGAGLGGADLTDGSGIGFQVISIDLSVSVLIELTETAGAGGSTASRVASFAGPGPASFSFASFANIANVDLTSIDRVRLTFSNPATAWDGAIDFISTTISEPSAIALFGLGLLGLGAARIRRAKA
ncbi:MAG: PEP-CTERM sorting domain-containing protein [Chromatiales bacterium]|nr:PEP-CTERM sorting domain-containing protein [Chromatiales bacterium]